MKRVSVFRFALQLLGRYLTGSVISLMLGLSVMLFLNNPFGRVLSQMLCFSAAFSLVYLRAWQTGNGDINLVEYHHDMENLMKGFKSGLLALVLPMIPSLILIFAKISGSFGGFLYVYRFLNPIFLPVNYSLLPATLSLNEISTVSVIISALLPLIFVILCGFGYALGYRNISVFKVLGRGKTEDKE